MLTHVSQYISELNATGTPWASEIGSFGFAPLAVVLFIFLIVAYPRVEVEGASRLGYLQRMTEAILWIALLFVAWRMMPARTDAQREPKEIEHD